MKILLVQPPFTISKNESKKCHPPLGLAYLTAVLRDAHEVIVLDSLAEGYYNEEIINKGFLRYGLSFNEIKKRIERIKPDVVGVSCLFSTQAKNAHNICQITKEIDRRIITILGGAHSSSIPEEVLRDRNLDFVVIGEAENTINLLLEYIERNKDLREIGGIGFKRNGTIEIKRRKEDEANLDNFPFPCWEIFPLEAYFSINNPHGSPARKTPFLPMITSRGCPFECIFCSIHNLWGRKYRIRTAENVLSELSYLLNKFGVREVIFEDDNLTLDRKRSEDIFRGIIERKLDINWNVPNGVAIQTLDYGLLELMKKSGCYGISVGVESGDEYILKSIIKKPLKLPEVKPVISWAKSLGLETTVFFVVGFPQENSFRLKNTFKFAEYIRADNTNFFFAVPLPGTGLLELCREKGLISGRVDYLRLRADNPAFPTLYLSKKRLLLAVRREKLKLYIFSFFRQPIRMFRKIWSKLLKEPKYFLKLVSIYIKVNDA